MRKDRDLAFHLELCIRKWVNLGLEPRTLQFLVCEAHQRLKGPAISEVRNQNAEVRSADVRSETRQSAESAKSVDVQSLDTAFSPVESDDTTAKAAKIAKAEPDSAAVTEQSAESAAVLSGTKPSVQSVESVDARSGTTPSAESVEGS